MTESRVCQDCGRPVRLGDRRCSRCRERAKRGVTTADRPLCQLPGCDNLARATQGRLCVHHAIPALLTHGEPGPLDTPCEIVDGAGQRAGDYGHAPLDGRSERAHRWMWEIYNGPIPAVMFVCHRCDRPGCVALDHLFLGTNADNMADKVAKGRGRNGTAGLPALNRKLTDEQADEIRERLAAGERGVRLAEEFDVDPTTISNIRHHRHY